MVSIFRKVLLVLIGVASIAAVMVVTSRGAGTDKSSERILYVVEITMGSGQKLYRTLYEGQSASWIIPGSGGYRFSIFGDPRSADGTRVSDGPGTRRVLLTPKGVTAGNRMFVFDPANTSSSLPQGVSEQTENGALVTLDADGAAGRLIQRLAMLQSYQRGGRAVRGQDSRGEIRLTRDWMLAFWPGALWQAHALSHENREQLREWALSATRIAERHSRTDSHDVGFMLGRSAATGYDQLCRAGDFGSRDCARMERRAVEAADNMMRMIASNPGGRTLPTRTSGCKRKCTPGQADTLIDSMPNITLLGWAAEVTGKRRYETAARRHADRVLRLLVRENGSTWQSAHTDRRNGKVVLRHTHQGLSDRSTWARGQAWGIYGFARLGEQLGSDRYLSISRRLARYWIQQAPKNRISRYDLDAVKGPRDSSAAAIAAAGMAILAEHGKLPRDKAHHTFEVASRSVGSDLEDFGIMGQQTYTYGGSDWDEEAEFMMGVDFLLEADNRLRASAHQ